MVTKKRKESEQGYCNNRGPLAIDCQSLIKERKNWERVSTCRASNGDYSRPQGLTKKVCGYGNSTQEFHKKGGDKTCPTVPS